MARPGVQVHGAVAVVLGPLVLVQHAHANGCSQRDAKLGARLDLDPVLFVSRCRDCALPGSAARHLWLDVRLVEAETWWAAVHDAAYAAAVRFAIAVSGVSTCSVMSSPNGAPQDEGGE